MHTLRNSLICSSIPKLASQHILKIMSYEFISIPPIPIQLHSFMLDPLLLPQVLEMSEDPIFFFYHKTIWKCQEELKRKYSFWCMVSFYSRKGIYEVPTIRTREGRAFSDLNSALCAHKIFKVG